MRKLYAVPGILMLLTAVLHTIGSFAGGQDSLQEKVLFASMDALRFPMGMGMEPSMADIYWGLVLIMTVTFAGLGLLNLVLWRQASNEVLRAAAWVNLIWVGAFTAVSWHAHVPPPFICGAVIEVSVVACLLARP